jgi:hypothetical protein
MSSFNTRITSLKTKASVGVRAADVLRECEMMEKQNTYLKTLLSEANDTEMFNHVLDSHLEAIAHLIPEFKVGAFLKRPVKTTLVNPITDKINILRDFIKHSTTSGMGSDYKFPEKCQVEIERQSQENAQQAMLDCKIVQRLEDIVRARANLTHPQPFNAPPTQSTLRTAQFLAFGTQSAQPTAPRTTFPAFGFGAHQFSASHPAPPAFGFGANQSSASPAFGFGANQSSASPSVPSAFGTQPPTYIGPDRNTFSVHQNTTTPTSSDLHPPIKKPRFESAPKQATSDLTQQLGATTTTTTATNIPPKQ